MYGNNQEFKRSLFLLGKNWLEKKLQDINVDIIKFAEDSIQISGKASQVNKATTKMNNITFVSIFLFETDHVN